MQHARKSPLVSQKVLDDKDYDLVFNQKKYVNYKDIWNTCKIQSLPGRKSACGSYQSCNVVYVCNNMEIRGLGSAIFQFISATNFQKNYHTVKGVLITTLAVNNYCFLIMAVTYPEFFWAGQYMHSWNYNTSRNNM